jgi:uncharacterized protein with HEPN domain
VSRTPRDRLADIVAAAARVSRAQDALEHAEASDAEDEAQLAFDALLYRLVVIGEAVKALPTDLLARRPLVPWREVARLRDLLARHYHRVDAQIIRRTVQTPLRELREAAVQLLAEEQDQARKLGE